MAVGRAGACAGGMDDVVVAENPRLAANNSLNCTLQRLTTLGFLKRRQESAQNIDFLGLKPRTRQQAPQT